jgi:antitoxin CptB
MKSATVDVPISTRSAGNVVINDSTALSAAAAGHSGVGSLATTDDCSVSDRLQPDRADIRHKRLLFRCWHRGTQESDLILGRFAETYLAGFDADQLVRFEALLNCTDPDLFDWILIGLPPPREYDDDVMGLIRAFSAQRHSRQLQSSTTT